MKQINLNYLKELLYIDSKDYYNLRGEIYRINYKLDLYEKIFKILSTPLEKIINNKIELESLFLQIYGNNNNFNKFISAIHQMIGFNKLKKYSIQYKKEINTYGCILEQLNKEYDLLKNELEIKIKEKNSKEFRAREFSNIIFNFKNMNVINNFSIKVLLDFFEEKNIKYKDRVLLLEYINNHNIKSKHGYFDNTIANMVNFGFENIDGFDYEYNDFIKNFINSKNIENYIKNLKQNYKKNEFKNIVLNIMKYYQELIYKQILEIQNINNYMDKSKRKSILCQYKKILNIYKILHNYYDCDKIIIR